MDHLRTLLSMDLPGRAIHRSAAWQQSPDRITLRIHGGRRRRHPKPRDLVCYPHDLPRSRAGARFSLRVRRTKVLKRRSLGPPAFGGSRYRDLPIQGRNDSNACGMLPCRHGSLLRGDALVNRSAAITGLTVVRNANLPRTRFRGSKVMEYRWESLLLLIHCYGIIPCIAVG